MVAEKFEEQDARFEKIDARFEKIDARFEKIDSRFEDINDRFDQQDAKINKLSKDMNWVKDILDSHTGMLRRLDDERLAGVYRTDRIEKQVADMKKQLKLA